MGSPEIINPKQPKAVKINDGVLEHPDLEIPEMTGKPAAEDGVIPTTSEVVISQDAAGAQPSMRSLGIGRKETLVGKSPSTTDKISGVNHQIRFPGRNLTKPVSQEIIVDIGADVNITELNDGASDPSGRQIRNRERPSDHFNPMRLDAPPVKPDGSTRTRQGPHPSPSSSSPNVVHGVKSEGARQPVAEVFQDHL